MNTKDYILEVSSEVTNLLLEKNAAYGDSALSPVGIFSKGEWSVYMHLKSTDSTPFYVGICKNTQKNKRPFEKSRRSEIWKRTYRKHGREVIILQDSISEQSAKNLEKWLIHMYGKRIDNKGPLVNITDGGEGFSSKHSEDSKRKMSNSKKGKTGDLCPNSHAVVAEGVRYGSMWEAARSLGVHGQTIKNRCQNDKFKDYYKL
jgi:hypothetical protein